MITCFNRRYESHDIVVAIASFINKKRMLWTINLADWCHNFYRFASDVEKSAGKMISTEIVIETKSIGFPGIIANT